MRSRLDSGQSHNMRHVPTRLHMRRFAHRLCSREPSFRGAARDGWGLLHHGWWPARQGHRQMGRHDLDPLGSGMDYLVAALAVFDDGTGSALYAGGPFRTAADVEALAVINDGTGPALYLGGQFTLAGGVPSNRIAKCAKCREKGRVTIHLKDSKAVHRWSLKVEVLPNPIWRRGRLFYRCPACGRRATRLYVPFSGLQPRCRRCWGLSYESQSWSYEGDASGRRSR